jgi:hypothetical protein
MVAWRTHPAGTTCLPLPPPGLQKWLAESGHISWPQLDPSGSDVEALRVHGPGEVRTRVPEQMRLIEARLVGRRRVVALEPSTPVDLNDDRVEWTPHCQ